MSSQFVHLRMHSEYSIVDGIVRLDAAVAKAASDGQPALAITDLSNTFAYIKFYKAARAAGIKPILGADIWITNDQDRDRPFRLLLLVQSNAGYRNLCELISRSWLKNTHRDRAEIRLDWLAQHADGLIALSGALQGELADAIARSSRGAANQNKASSKSNAGSEPSDLVLQKYLEIFGDRFYIEVQRADQPGEESYIRQAVALAVRHQVPIVATHPVQFLEADDFRSHEARVCIAEGETLASGRRRKRFTPAQYFLTQEEMAARFADMPQALENTLEIAQRCNVVLQLGKAQLPDFPTPNGETLEDYLRLTAREGLEKRLIERYPTEAVRESHRQHYADRLELEIKTIIEMGFPGYFLIVADFINWAKQNGVPVGPGRGSGSQSR
jgi:DNA polymerase-3 subunit alpha